LKRGDCDKEIEKYVTQAKAINEIAKEKKREKKYIVCQIKRITNSEKGESERE
jgi:hypothetical protein